MAQQSNQTSTFKAKAMNFFRMLCAQPVRSCEEPKTQSKIAKKKIRMTYALDRAIVKLSRKNIITEDFPRNGIITEYLQKYITNRLTKMSTVLLQGDFTDACLLYIMFPIYFTKRNKFHDRFRIYNEVKADNDKLFKVRQGSLDAVVIQLYYSEKKSQKSIKLKMNAKPTQEEQAKQNIQEQLNKIEETLKYYGKSAFNYIFICGKEFDIDKCHELLVFYKDSFMFEIQKIMNTESQLCTVVYVSNNAAFLKIDDDSFSEFLAESLVTNGQKVQTRDFDNFLRLMKAQMHLEVCSTLGQVLSQTEITNHRTEFWKVLRERYPKTIQYISAVSPTISKSSIENTPLFKPTVASLSFGGVGSYHSSPMHTPNLQMSEFMPPRDSFFMIKKQSEGFFESLEHTARSEQKPSQ